jgi:peptidyl-prolyl cis-trans isomerase SurA
MKLDSIANEIKAGRLTFEEAARTFSDSQTKIEGGAVTNPQTGNNRFTIDVLRQVFTGVSVERMSEGDMSGVIMAKNELNQDVFKVVRLTKIIEPHKANLVDDYDKIYLITLQKAKNDKLSDWAEKMIKNTYIKISDSYKDCNFNLNWLKK